MQRFNHRCGAIAVILSLLGAAELSSAALLYDNGPLITRPGGGFSGRDLSEVQTTLGLSVSGFGAQGGATGNRVADNFGIGGGGWRIDEFVFFAYQTGAPISSPPIDVANLRIWDGPPGDSGSAVLLDLANTNLVPSGGVTFTNVYRALDTSPTDSQRAIWKVRAVLPTSINLNAGAYWVDWQLAGAANYSGPWVPPVTILGQLGKTGANARIFIASNNAWSDVSDAGNPPFQTPVPQDLPFQVIGVASGGSAVAPSSFTVFRGSLISGGLPELLNSDDQYLVVRNGPIAQPSEAPITVLFEGVVSQATASQLDLKVEAKVSISNLQQQVDLFDWQANSYAQTDTRPATTADQVVSIAGTNPSRYVNSSKAVRARYRVRPAGALFTNNWRASIDMVQWTYAP